MAKHRASEEPRKRSLLHRLRPSAADRRLLHKASGILLTVVLINSTIFSVLAHVRGVPDKDLYNWWDTLCLGHHMIYYNAQSLTPPYEADEVADVLYHQQDLFRNTADTLEILPFRHPTDRQQEGRLMVISALRTAQQDIKVLPLATLHKQSPDALALSAQQLTRIYENYVSRLSVGIDKVGAGSTENIAAIRQLPQCTAFL